MKIFEKFKPNAYAVGKKAKNDPVQTKTIEQYTSN